ncbi:putative Fam13 [Fasciolopsis buskii]|uniref:Putative Fam13 n=1 Tax=Fasciolopsis buskii TaxID=27845 RepID=A0A8E0RWB6_9TREM|nr:putative Fam13 [Fasciolopsis buski]
MLMARLVRKFGAEPYAKNTCRTNPDRRSFCATFGVSLNDVITRDGTDIPLVVLDVFHFLLNCDALKCEGIFRVNGNSRTVDTLRSMIDGAGPKWRISQFTHESQTPERSPDVHSVASLLKLYLRQLPGGLVPSDITNSLIEAYLRFRGSTTTLFCQITLNLGRLATANYALLQHLCHFLHQVWKRRYENKMSSEALGIVFGPNVFSFNPDKATIQDQGAVNQIMTILVERTEVFFHLNLDCSSVGIDSSVAEVRKTKRKTSVHASDADLEDHSSDCDSPSNSTELEEKNYAPPFADLSYFVLCDNDIGSSSFAMPYLNKLRREEFSPQISSAIRACIDQHIFGGLQSATQKLSLDTNYLYDCSSSAVKSDCVAEPALSEYDYLSADELERDYHVAPGIHVLFTDPDPLRTPAVGGCAQTPKLLCQLTQRLHLIRKAIRDYERHFEKERGRKPNTAEKKTDLKICSLMTNLAEVRGTIKQLQNRSDICERESVANSYDIQPQGESIERNSCHSPTRNLQFDGGDNDSVGRAFTLPVHSALRSTEGDWSPAVAHQMYNVDIEAATALENSKNLKTTEIQPDAFGVQQISPSSMSVHTRHNSLPTGSLGTTVPKPDQTLSETLAVLTHRLAEKRCSAKRPECLQLMTRKQVEDEKLDLQKALLYFEGLHGRPSGRQERLIMRPLYDRYRSVKRMLAQEYQLDRISSTSSDFLKVMQAEPKHIVSSEGDSSQTEKPLSYTTSFHVPPATLGSAKDSWDKELRSKFSGSPTKDSGESTHSETVQKKQTRPDEANGDTIGSPRPLSVGYQVNSSKLNRSEIELNGCFDAPPSDDRRALVENPLSADGDAESPERASLNLASNIKPIDGSISNLSFNKPVSTQIDVGNAENPQETGSGAAALTSVTAAECRARVTGSNMEENLVTASSSNGRVSLGKNTHDDLADWSLSRLKYELNTVRESKRHLQKILKDFEHDFEQTMGHKVERADRSSMRDEYTRYKFLKSRLVLLENELRGRIN